MRIKTAFRAAAALLLCVLFVLPLASCSGRKVFEYKGYSYDEHYYSYWLSRFKYNFINRYSDVRDTDEYYDSVINGSGETADTVMTRMSDEIIKGYLVSEYLCDQIGLRLTDSMLDALDGELEMIVDEQFGGRKKDFDRKLSESGLSYRKLRDIYIIEKKYDLLYEYYTGTYLKENLTDEIREEYCRENYAKAFIIYLPLQYRLNVSESGDYIYDEHGGYTIPLTEDEIRRNRETAELIEKTLTVSNFTELQKQYNQDPASSVYKNGYYFSKEMDYSADVISKALSMAPGTVSRVDIDRGIYFIYRRETEGGAYADDANSDFFGKFETNLLYDLFDDMITGLRNEVTVYEKNREGVSIKTVKAGNDY